MVLLLRLVNELALHSAQFMMSAAIPLVTSKPRWHDVGTLSSMRLAANVATVAGMLKELPLAVDANMRLPSVSWVIVTLLPARRRLTRLEASNVVPVPAVLSSRCCLKASLISVSPVV